MATLKYVITIPSIDIQGSVSISDLALVGSKHELYGELQAENPVMAKYLAAFRSPTGKAIHPSTVVRDASLPKVDANRLCRFRNAVAVSSVLLSRTNHYVKDDLLYGGAYCTDLFDFYPVSVSSDGTDLIGETVYERSVYMQVDEFLGSTTPAVIFTEQVAPVFDQYLMVWLLNLLEHRARRKADIQIANRVFRSIELAYHALRAPMVNLRTPTDFGVSLSLWGSAFDALAYPDKGNVNRGHVLSLISTVAWQHQGLRRKVYADVTPCKKGNRGRAKVTLPMQVYIRLCLNRNEYVHGNPDAQGRYEFVHRKNWGNLWFQVPALYRCVLCQCLSRYSAKTRPAFSDTLVNAYEEALLKKPRQSG